MKKFLLVALLALTSSLSYSQNTWYSTVDVFNGSGVNATDFVFTYDNDEQCDNNINVVNNLNIRTVFNFEVYLNGRIKHSGSVNLAPGGSYFFNDAFYHCSSSSANITVRCW